MNEFYLNRMPIVTGTPSLERGTQGKPKQEAAEVSFQQVLQNTMQAQRALTFSKHAAQRVEQRGIELSESSLARLDEGVRLARQKGLGDTLILVDQTAFLVSVRDNRVITTVNNGELKGNVFTNIDGTVII